MLENVTEITTAQLLGEVQQMSNHGYRFITTSCIDMGNGTFDLLYHFDRDGQLKNFRLTVGHDVEVPSISKLIFSALLVENEIKELFGVNITDIIIDYGGHLLLSEGAPSTPMACGGQITIEQRSEKGE
ncbi:MAG TPA: NADH-quinone oxidoreductase subunit C [Armatimonadota bacterium]|jgi:NADH:ubiquinone oxidoreductase subunit C